MAMDTIKYQTEYKCNRCDKLVKNTKIVEKDKIGNLVYSFFLKSRAWAIHNCSDGGIGIADFIGAKPIDVSKMKFKECDICASKPGIPVLCESCSHNRAVIENLKKQVK